MRWLGKVIIDCLNNKLPLIVGKIPKGGWTSLGREECKLVMLLWNQCWGAPKPKYRTNVWSSCATLRHAFKEAKPDRCYKDTYICTFIIVHAQLPCDGINLDAHQQLNGERKWYIPNRILLIPKKEWNSIARKWITMPSEWDWLGQISVGFLSCIKPIEREWERWGLEEGITTEEGEN